MKITRQPPLILDMMYQKQLENAEYFKYFKIISDERYTREIKSRIFMAKPAFNKMEKLCTSKLEQNLRGNLLNC
jgi:hypothetical protein